MVSKWQKQEKRVAKRIGGRRQPGSGSGWIHKNDVVSEDCLFELKRTDKRQITIKADDIDNLCYNAALLGKTPVFHIEVGGRRYVLVEEADFFGP